MKKRDRLLWEVGLCKGRFETLPAAVPAGNVDVSGGGRWRIWQDAGTRIDAPILGNGDLLAALAGTAEYPQFWFSTNDFWQMESAASWEFFHDNDMAKVAPAMGLGSPRPIGRLVFSAPALREAVFCAEQDYRTATTTATYTVEGREALRLSSYVAATENVLIVHMTAMQPLRLTYEVRFPDEVGRGCDIGVDFDGSCEDEEVRNDQFIGLVGGKPLQVKKRRASLISGWREFSDHVDVPVKAGFAGDFLEEDGREEASLALMPGKDYVFALAVRTWDKVSRPYEYARSRVRWMRREDEAVLRAQHLAWWEAYWTTSGVVVHDEVLRRHYYLSQYMLGSVSRDPDYPPNILGISTFDRPAWNGNYKINYNHQSPYLGLLSAGHFAQADSHDAPYLAMLDITREMSQRLLGHEGAYYPLGLGPKGMVSEALLLYMKSPAVHGALNMIQRYELTLDQDYGRRVYPFLRSVADFWEKDLVLREGRYHVVGDGMHERVTRDIRENGLPEDPVNTLGYLKTFFETMPRIARDLGVDVEKKKRWETIASSLAPFPMGTVREITDNPTLWKEADATLADLLPREWLDRPIFYDEGRGGKWSFHFPGNIMHIYPGNAVTTQSSKEEREAAWNTVHIHALVEDALAKWKSPRSEEKGDPKAEHLKKAGAWNADNLSCLFFPAAVRASYDPSVILRELRERIKYRGLSNGYYEGNPHGIENLSTVPNTLQEMMLQSHEHILRIFPNWPSVEEPEAAFYDLWAYGAFQVSASLAAGEVAEVRVRSRKGSPCRLENPWPNKEVCLEIEGQEKPLIIAGAYLDLPAVAGEYRLSRADLASDRKGGDHS